jgi:TetR/AcrR family transcriptional regulator, transcriptional repressor for nem operon
MTDTKTRLLDEASALVQTRGYNGFSFHDLSGAVGIKTASIHYYFPTKADLGEMLVQRYSTRFLQALGSPDDGTPEACLIRYTALFRASLDQGRMCLCGMVGAELSGVPEAVSDHVAAFFAANQDWLGKVLARAGTPEPLVEAQLFLATLEGALMIARVTKDNASFDAVATASIARLGL